MKYYLILKQVGQRQVSAHTVIMCLVHNHRRPPRRRSLSFVVQ